MQFLQKYTSTRFNDCLYLILIKKIVTCIVDMHVLFATDIYLLKYCYHDWEPAAICCVYNIACKRLENMFASFFR